MASIQGVKVTGVIVPSNTLDTYPVIDPIYGVDGLRNLSGGTSDLNLITTDRRRAGMLVGINNGSNYYKLNSAPWDNTLSDWTPFSLGDTSPITIVNTSNLFSTGLDGTGLNSSGVTNSNFFGVGAGRDATNASNSNFFGIGAGVGATNASSSNFFGIDAGNGATGAYNLNAFGIGAGRDATGAYSSNFFGGGAGFKATNAYSSNFFGNLAGIGATGASESNFFGNSVGYWASGANNSNFFGSNAGKEAKNASYSNLFGFNVGNSTVLGSLGSNNIIIGTNISLPSGTTNSINLGGVLFGTGTYSTTTGNPSIVAQSTGKIGINKINPTNTLHIYSETANTSGLRLERLTSTSPTSTGQAIGVDSNGNVVAILAGSGGGSTFSGGTVTNPTIFTNGLTANTFSATTYLNLPINLQKTISASYTATSADNNYTILINNGATPISITIPSGLLDKINLGFIQQGSADVTFVEGAGVTINSPANMLKIKGQHYWAYLEHVTNSNIYQLVGSLKL